MVQKKQKEFLSSQSLVPIDQVREGIAVLKNGALLSVLNVSGINFELKSESEQNDIINTWNNFLNNLGFSLQVLVQSRKINISNYINGLREKTQKETNELLKIQIEDYLEFIQNFVDLYSVIRKNFYVIVSYEPIVTERTSFVKKIGESFKSMLNFTRPAFTISMPLTEEDFNKYQKQLLIRQNNVINGLARIGLASAPLTTDELIKLFYNLYNPETFEKQKVELPQEAV